MAPTAASIVAGETFAAFVQGTTQTSSGESAEVVTPGSGSDRDVGDLKSRGNARPTTLTSIGTPEMSEGAREAVLDSVPVIHSVEISGLVLLKIIQEWERVRSEGFGEREAPTKRSDLNGQDVSCSGQLLGCIQEVSTSDGPNGTSGVLRVTSAFPVGKLATTRGTHTPSTYAHMGSGASTAFLQQRAAYLWEMNSMLREVNREHLVVGWFCVADSGQLASFVNADWTETQYQYQRWMKNAVCIVYDPLRRASSGTLGVRVVRLSIGFMREYGRLMQSTVGQNKHVEAVQQAFGRGGGRVAAGSTFVSEILRALGLCSQTIIEEVPFTFKSSALIEQYLASLTVRENSEASLCVKPLMNLDCERLMTAPGRELVEQTVETLVQDMDELTREQSRYQHFLRNFSRIKVQQVEWIRKRKLENEQRRAAGQEPLPENKLPNCLSGVSEPSRLEPMMVVRDLTESLRDLELVVAGCCEKDFATQSLWT